MTDNRIDYTWNVAEAKARFSELLDLVDKEGPQVISKRGQQVAVVVPIDEWRRKTDRSGSLAQFLADSPLRDSGVELDPAARGDERSGHRDVVL